MMYVFNCEEFIYGTFEDCIGLYNSHYFSSYSESLLGNIHFTMAMLQKCCTVSSKTSTILFALFFWSLYLALMLVVSHVNLLHIHVSTHPENGY